MLDSLEMVRRRYELIVPDAGAEMTQSQADSLVEWLEREIGSVVTPLLDRPDFRRHVRWPIERLTGERNCPERDAVVAVEQSLIRSASMLATVASEEPIERGLLRLGPNQEEVEMGDLSTLDPGTGIGKVPPSPLGLRQVEFIARKPWRDLASASDLFSPIAQFNFTEADDGRWAKFSSFFNEQLSVPGDFIARCLGIRVSSWRSDLQRFYVRCMTSQQRAGLGATVRWRELSDVLEKLNTKCETLRSLCFEGQEARLRDSCLALVQIYAGFHSNVDFDWLRPVAKMAGNVSGMRYLVEKRHEWIIPEKAATALVDIEELVRQPQSPEDLIEEEKTTKRLVLIEEQREGFLDGKPISKDEKLDWHDQPSVWEFLWTLADRALLKKNVDRTCLSIFRSTKESDRNVIDSEEEDLVEVDPKEKKWPTPQAVKDRRADLKKLIVPELNGLIVPAGTGTYRLKLQPDEIGLLGWENDERLERLEPNKRMQLDTLLD